MSPTEIQVAAEEPQGSKVKAIFDRIVAGLRFIYPSIAVGVFIASALALSLPSMRGLYAVTTAKLHGNCFLQSLIPWWNSLALPAHHWIVVVTASAALVWILHQQLWHFLLRCYTYSIYEATVLWSLCSFLMLTRESLWLRLIACLVGIAGTSTIAYFRAPQEINLEPLVVPDQPITNSSEDKLDRRSIVVTLVKQLLDDCAPVIAIVGGYGDGKTSLLNLIDEQLREKKRIAVVRFKSSLPGDHYTLVSTLFNSIGQQLHQRFFVRRLSRILNKLARKLSGLVPSAPSGLKDIFADDSQEDELKELTGKLDRLPVRRVVVLLDDMDRMQSDELRILLRIIRAADEYPKLSFVCAMSKKALVDALIRHQVKEHLTIDYSSKVPAAASGTFVGQLSADDVHAGYEFLEKFFPVQVPVPKLDDVQAGKEFDARFHRFLERAGLPNPPATDFNEKFQPLWKAYFLPSLNNLRKLNSYFNALNSSFGLVSGEVHLQDFMCIELLRQVQPQIYEDVFKNRSLFYNPEWDVFRWDERKFDIDENRKKARLRGEFDQVFRHLYGDDREFTLSLLSRLFPNVNDYYAAPTFENWGKESEIEADKSNRIYHPDHFGTYFSLHVPEGYCSTRELESVIEGASNSTGEEAAKEFFVQYLRHIDGVKRYRFFEKSARLEGRFNAISGKALALAVASESNLFTYDDLDIGEFGAAVRLELVLANKFRDSPEIMTVLRGILAESATVALAEKVFLFSSDKESNKIFESWTFVDVEELKTAYAMRMKARYFPGGANSIYDSGTTYRDWQALISWSRIGAESQRDVRDYLADEFERRPASIGKHLQWLWNSIGNTEGRQLVDNVFPLGELAKLAKKYGSSSYSTEHQRNVVEKVIKEFGA